MKSKTFRGLSMMFFLRSFGSLKNVISVHVDSKSFSKSKMSWKERSLNLRVSTNSSHTILSKALKKRSHDSYLEILKFVIMDIPSNTGLGTALNFLKSNSFISIYSGKNQERIFTQYLLSLQSRVSQDESFGSSRSSTGNIYCTAVLRSFT